MADITVTQTRSAIGTKPKHRGTLRALGLGRIGQTNTLPDRPEIRGMIARVSPPHRRRRGRGGPQGSTKANEPAKRSTRPLPTSSRKPLPSRRTQRGRELT